MSELLPLEPELQNSPADPLPPEATAGISQEDQKEIRSEIDRIQQESRIQVTPEIMAVKAAKRGVAFPLLVNLFAVALLAAGGFALWHLFQRGETAAATGAAAVSSAEGKLIAELKREAEEQLLQKNREIDDIQSRLRDIDRERQDLQRSMDARIKAREEELRRGLEAALGAEREKLRGQGVSEAEINRRLQTLEAEKAATFDRELAGFRAQAEEERRKAEASLQSLQAEYQRSLAQASADRDKVLEESRAREAELRTQLAAQTQALEQQGAEAQRELNRLGEQRAKESQAASQLAGLYSRVKADLLAARYEQALNGLQTIRDFLDDPSVSALPAMRDRREIELFVVDSISSLARSQMQSSATDTRSLVAAANLLTDLKARVNEADELLRAAQAAPAQAKYQEALALIPEVSRAHERLTEVAAAEERGRREALQAQVNELKAQLAAAGSGAAALQKTVQDRNAEIAALRAERDRVMADGTAAAAALQKTLEDKTRELEEMRARLSSSDSGAAALQKAVLEKDGEIAALRAERDQAVAAGATQAAALKQSLEEKSRELEGLRDQLASASGGAEALQKAIAEKDAEIAALKAERDSLRALSAAGGAAGPSGGDAGAPPAELQERLAGLEQELASKLALIQTLEGEKMTLQSEVASLKGEIEELKRAQGEQATRAAEREAQLEQKITRLERIQARYDQLVSSYQDYAGREDSLLSAQGDKALLESKLYLNAFLAAGSEAFPGLWERIKRYDEAFEKAGRAAALGDVNDVLIELSLRDRAEAQALFLQSETARYQDNPQMVGLLEELQRVVGR